MRVLQVSHRFPPAHRAGTERYTEALALGLVARGHGVEVLTAEKDVSRPHLSVGTRAHRGLPVTELVNDLFHTEFEQTWRLPAAERALADVLERLRPDVVHVQHLLYLSTGLPRVAREHGAAVVMTLHDFSFECARLGQLVHADGGLCETVDLARCGTCLPSFPWRQSDLARRVGEGLSLVRRVSGLDLAPLATRLARGAGATAPAGASGSERAGPGGGPRSGSGPGPGSGPDPAPAPVDPAQAAAYAEHARRRQEAWRAALSGPVQRVIAPSAFLRDRALAFGLDPARVVHVPTGVERPPRPATAPGVGRPSGGPLRVLFLGTRVPLKGAHVLLEAWGRLTPERRARGRLELFGPGGHDPAYEARLSALADASGAHLGAALDGAGVAAALARADLLVVPSTWYENRPLVMLEALAAGVPLLASAAGGMGELVREGRDGWTFPLGDAEALAARLARLLDHPEEARALRPDASALPTFDDTVERTLALYAEAREELP